MTARYPDQLLLLPVSTSVITACECDAIDVVVVAGVSSFFVGGVLSLFLACGILDLCFDGLGDRFRVGEGDREEGGGISGLECASEDGAGTVDCKSSDDLRFSLLPDSGDSASFVLSATEVFLSSCVSFLVSSHSFKSTSEKSPPSENFDSLSDSFILFTASSPKFSKCSNTLDA